MPARTLTVLGVATLLLTSIIAAPVVSQQAVSDAYDDGVSGATEPATGLLDSTPDYATTSGVDGHPEWVITVEEQSDLATLRTWTNQSADRTWLRNMSAVNQAVIRAPRVQVFGGYTFDGVPSRVAGLDDLSYVSGIAINQQVSMPEPITTPARESEFQTPPAAWATDGSFTQDGVAWSDDIQESSMLESKQAMSADGVSPNGSGTTVGIVDSGLNVDNASNSSLFQNRLTAGKDFVDDETGVENLSSSNYHGSWVASAIAADPNTTTTDEPGEGVAPGANLAVARALGDDGSGSASDIAAAIRWTEAQGADVISLSLGSQRYSPTIAAAIEDALAGNTTLVVVAAGNSRQQPGHLRYIASPADVPREGVVAVGATNVSAPENAGSAYFSSVGPDNGASDLSRGVTNGEAPDIAAPGTAVTVPIYDEDGFRINDTKTGTSMAAPKTAAATSVLLDDSPSLENETSAVRERVLQTASPVPAAGTTEVGHGMINVSNLLSDTRPETEQVDARTTPAQSRDTANEEYSGSRPVKWAIAAEQRAPLIG